MKYLLSLFLLFVVLVTKVSACSICFYGDPGSKANIALRWSVFVLLIILLGVLSAFITFFLSLRKRSKIISQHIH